MVKKIKIRNCPVRIPQFNCLGTLQILAQIWTEVGSQYYYYDLGLRQVKSPQWVHTGWKHKLVCYGINHTARSSNWKAKHTCLICCRLWGLGSAMATSRAAGWGTQPRAGVWLGRWLWWGSQPHNCIPLSFPLIGCFLSARICPPNTSKPSTFTRTALNILTHSGHAWIRKMGGILRQAWQQYRQAQTVYL